MYLFVVSLHVLLCLFLVIVILLQPGKGGDVGSAFGGNLAATERLPHVQQVVVEPGDSLWSIVQRVAPGHDPRPIVDAIADARGTSAVEVGETLTVPAP